MPAQPLTPRQLAVLRWLYDRTRTNGYQPSYVETMRHFGWRSPQSVRGILQALERKGWVKVQPRESRAVRFLLRPDGQGFGGFSEGGVGEMER